MVAFAKGQGTGNDFVLIVDPDGELAPTAEQVAALCDRRFGVGADGLILATRTAAMPEAERALGGGAEWFMDYRNADGSVAEMCGNGIRVFARLLEQEGLADVRELVVGTRAGIKHVRAVDDGFSADLGVVRLEDGEPLVRVDGLPVARPGQRVDVGNPHVVVAIADDAELAALDLHAAPEVEPATPGGVNVELVVPQGIADDEGRIRMRVHERGSGETLSCGTGAVAAAFATRHWAGGAPDRWRVEVPGGVVRVDVEQRPDGEHAWLTGPAAIVFRGATDLV
ncbi:diaminopimelate epimerase [Agrococcus sp. SGAir0287]|uniref:diaminopimelate epimerase n=1 Tax=Agrococcus sp. SGAir0287 TaxID=2070347 RepID=UPI0010CCE733|nr:diaminopimelate epimerase [Agrococcus sp. SGAir0287]QCR19612.1 diaminopimelate epimerase [Agrococcus sp. SGAir0287]